MLILNQWSIRLNFGQIESAKYCQENDIVVQAWSPLGSGEVLQNKILNDIASLYGKSSAHICLRWLIQKNIVPLPKSTHVERIISNTDVFDFELTDEQIKTIDQIPYCGGMRFNPDEAKS